MFFPSNLIRLNTFEGLQVFLFQTFNGYFLGGTVDRIIHPVKPVHTLPIHVRERTECPAKQEIPFHIPNGIFDLSFGLGIVWFAEPWSEATITEKVIELRIPRVIFGFYCPLDDYLFDVVIEDLPSISSEVFKRVVVALDENMYPRGVKISDDEMKMINLVRDQFHGEWNYTISPN